MARIVTLFILYFCSIPFLRAQQAIRYTTDNGLPSNHIYQIEQDPDGFMWFATNMGVTKFDGKAFKTFTTKDGLPTNDIWRIEATSNGMVWFFAKSRRLGYIYHDSVFSFPLEGNMVQHPHSLVVYENSIGFVASYDNQSGNYEFKDGKWVMDHFVSKKYLVEHIYRTAFLLPKNYKIIVANGRNDYVDANENCVFSFKSTAREREMAKNLASLVAKYYYYKTNEHAVIANPYFIYFYDIGDSTMYAKNLFEKEYTDEEKLANYPEMQQYKKNYQISRLNEWLAFDAKLNVLERRIFDDDEAPVHIFKDHGGNFWKATNSGITVYSNTSVSNKYYFKKKKVQTINFENGHLFVNVANEGWYILDPISGKAEMIIHNIGKVYEMGYHEDFKEYYFYNSRCYWHGKDLHKLKKIGEILLPLTGRGIYPYNGGAKTVIEQKFGFSAINLTCFYDLDSNFNFLPSTLYQNSDAWYTQGTKALIEHNGKIYAGGDGLYQITYNKKPEPNSNALLQASVNTIIKFNDEFMLVGTDGFGAYFYDGNDIIIPVKETEGAIINKIIIKDDKIWFATGNGVHQYTGTNPYNYKKTESIFDEDGLLENNINSICIVGDQLYVAQDHGMVSINLSKDKYKRNIKPYYAGNKYYDNEKNIYKVKYGTNISIPFGVMSFPSQKYINYYYKINTDDQWTSTKSTTISLGKQPPGAYTVHFFAVDQHRNIGSTAIDLIIIPLWYQTLSVKILFLFIGLILIISITIFFRKRLENKRKTELLLSKTMSDLELKALRSQMNPHFVFNSLNAIQYYIIKNKSELSEEYLAKFSRLIRLFFEYSKFDSLKLHQEVDLLRRYLEIEKLRFENKLEYNIYVDSELDVEDIEVPSMILQPIVENAVNHGIFHKKGNGLINLSFQRINASTMLISIIDDGVGILAMKEIQQDDSGNYRSKSSEVIKDRLKILSDNKLSKWKVDYKIVDRSTINPNKTGTLVEIILHFNF